jgi:glycosyltransferase involved in cell wall biosynthesis
MRRADVVFAPSRFVADHLAKVHNIGAQVLRPPFFLECTPSPTPPFALPERFLFHFGQLMERKGTSLLARALPLAWRGAPDLTMVWSGRCRDERKLEEWRSWWGERAGQVVVTGALRKPDVYSILQRAEAAVLPSQVDNLPNTVIESLMFGVPVLGTCGASIDELVEEGRTGHLIALGDVAGLADALVAVWHERSRVTRGFDWDLPVARAMKPECAVANLIALASGTINRSHAGAHIEQQN